MFEGYISKTRHQTIIYDSFLEIKEKQIKLILINRIIY